MGTTLLTAVASLIVALISNGIAIWNRRKTDNNTAEIQTLKSAMDRDLERFRAQLTHGQTVSATQWNAEFIAYQAVWKGIVEARPIADKLVNREGELNQIGLPEEYLGREDRLKYRMDITQQLLTAGQNLLSSVHENAPFYPAPIRHTANEAHKAITQLVRKNLKRMAETVMESEVEEIAAFRSECEVILLRFVREVDKLEMLIRDRLAAVQIVDKNTIR